MHKLSIFLISLLFMVASLSAWMEKSQAHKHLEIIRETIPASQVEGNMRLENISGIPRAIYSPDYQVAGNHPETMARDYLLSHAELLQHTASGSALRFLQTVETPAGYRVQFVQEIEGIPVYGASIKVSLNRQNEVVFVTNGYQRIGKISIAEKISNATALQIAENHLEVKGPHTFQSVATIIYPQSTFQALVAKQVTLVPRSRPYGDWEILIDANSGELLRVENKACSYDGLRETGIGWVYDPDPITAAKTYYGQSQFSDNGGANNDSLEHYLKQVSLEGISFIDSQYRLSGPYASIVDVEEPFTELYAQNSINFRFTRDQEAFEAVNIYYHLNHSMEYLNDSLGFDVLPYQYEGGVQFDPHGLDGETNAHYLGSTGHVAFGSPSNKVDAGEDQAIIIHELGHGIHHWITQGELSQVDGLSEGLSDYWAQSYNRSLGLFSPEDAQYDYFGQWGLQPLGGNSLRVTDYTGHYPESLVDQVHHDGQLWSSSLMSIYDLIGRTATDTDCWEGISMTDRNSNQVDAAFAVIQADRDNYDGNNLGDIVPVFIARGYLPGPVMVAFSADVTGGVGPLTVNFEDESIAFPGPISSWQWDFNSDGIVDAVEQHPQHVFTEAGGYTVTLIASNGSDADTLVIEDFVSVNSGTLVYDGQSPAEGVHDYSGTFIYDQLIDVNIDARYTNQLPSSLIGFDAVFVSLGNLGESASEGTILQDNEINALIEYAQAGGNIYSEGGSLMGGMALFGIPNYEAIWNLFSIDFASFAYVFEPVGSLEGQSNSLADGIIFESSTQTNSWYIDHFVPGETGFIAFREPTYGTSAIQGIGEFGQKTFHFSYALAELVDNPAPSTRLQTLLKIVEFFNLPLLAPSFSTSLQTGHAPLSVEFTDVSASDPEILTWEWDFESDGIIDSEDQNPIWVYEEPGIYTVTLTISNADTIHSKTVENAVQVFNGESALHFDGLDNVILINTSPLLDMTEALTIEAWIYPTSWGNFDDGEGRVYDKSFIRLFLNKDGTSQFPDSSLGLIMKHQDGTLSKIGTVRTSIRLNEWQHIAMTYDGATSEIHIYVNGIERTAIHTAPSGPIMNHSMWELQIGNDRTRSFPFDGRIDELRIWERAVTLDELTPAMSEYLEGDEEGLVAYFKMNEAHGDTLYDFTSNGHLGSIQNTVWVSGTDFVVPVGVADMPELPISHLILENYPNPFNPSTSIRYGLPVQSTVNIEIFDTRGRRVEKISFDEQSAGWHQLLWNGYDQYGAKVHSGIYFCRIRTDHDYQTIKMLMLK